MTGKIRVEFRVRLLVGFVEKLSWGLCDGWPVAQTPRLVGRAPRQVGRAPGQVGRAPGQVGRATGQVGS